MDGHSRLVGWLKVALPLLALAILSTLFLVARTIDPEAAIPYAEVDIAERIREPRMTAPAYAGVTKDGATLTLTADEARPEAEGDGSAVKVHAQLATPDGARTALTAVCKAISAETVVHNVTINNLLPERIDTPRQQFLTERQAKLDGTSYDEARRKLADTVAAKRFGTTEEFASMCAFLCSTQASFICGQNIQIDGGSYKGLM